MSLLFIHWNISPDIFLLPESWPVLGGWGLRWYGLLFSLGFVTGFYFIMNVFKREGKREEDLDLLSLVMVLSTIIGARLGHCLFYEPAIYLNDPIRILNIREGGLASHGAVIGILLGLWIFVRLRPAYSYLWIVDRIAIPTALAGCFIRLGNLMNSEIVGAPTTVPWGFIFDRTYPNEARHPSQLYEALFYLASFFILRWFYNKMHANTPSGFLFGLWMVLIFGFRFLVEFLKEVQEAFEQNLPLNMGQMLSLPLIVLGVWMIWRVRSQTALAMKAGTLQPK